MQDSSVASKSVSAVPFDLRSALTYCTVCGFGETECYRDAPQQLESKDTAVDRGATTDGGKRRVAGIQQTGRGCGIWCIGMKRERVTVFHSLSSSTISVWRTGLNLRD